MAYAIGIDLGGTKLLSALIDKASGKVLTFVKKKTKKALQVALG